MSIYVENVRTIGKTALDPDGQNIYDLVVSSGSELTGPDLQTENYGAIKCAVGSSAITEDTLDSLILFPGGWK